MILLYHESTTSGMIATSSHPVAGDHLPARQYTHEGNYVAIDGLDHVASHDADAICRIPGYRLALPSEQEAYYASKKKKGRISEKADGALEEK